MAKTEKKKSKYLPEKENKHYTEKITIGAILSLILYYVAYNNKEKYKGLSLFISITTILLKITLGTILILVLAFISFTLISTIIENKKYKTFKHGMKIDINGHKMVVSVEGERNEKTIVVLTGFSSASPVLHYKPFAEAIRDKYRVVTLEPFGYGLSDNFDPKGHERTVENIVSELHSVVKQLGINKYYLMGHSIGGAYSLYWSNVYPDEVLGFIGIDATVYVDDEIFELTDEYIQKMGKLRIIGIQRMMSLFNKRNVFLPLYEKYQYTDEEIDRFRVLSIRNFNKLMLDESRLMMENVRKVKDMKFPKHVPVVNFICEVNVKAMPTWEELHFSNGTQSVSNEVIVLPGDHSFFFIDNIDTVRAKIDEMTA